MTSYVDPYDYEEPDVFTTAQAYEAEGRNELYVAAQLLKAANAALESGLNWTGTSPTQLKARAYEISQGAAWFFKQARAAAL